MAPTVNDNYKATKNACKLCTPLGASLAFKGIRGSIPFLHGSQGCATYIRRYLISHFKEPMDIASSNFSEETAVFGGGANLKTGLENISRQYHPEMIGIATTCLSETIGDDVPMFLDDYLKHREPQDDAYLVHVSTASFKGTHRNGYNDAVRSIVSTLSKQKTKNDCVNILPGMISPSDIRYLKEILEDFDTKYIMLPDYSETLDGGLWPEYQKIPEGGTKIEDIISMGDSKASIEFGRVLSGEESAAKVLEEKFGTRCYTSGLPIGIKETDVFFKNLEKITGKKTPSRHVAERQRLIDAYVDGHKYVSGKKAVVYGDEELVIGIVSFLSEIGIEPVICATGGECRCLRDKIKDVMGEFYSDSVNVFENIDFIDIKDKASEYQPDFLIGNSKGYSVARKLDLPLVRIGFPIHDRVGGSRMMHIGYRGAQNLFDQIANTLIRKKQESSGIGYSYI